MHKGLLAISALGALGLTGCDGVAPSRPNVIVILMDDMGYGDMGAYGQQKIETPNLDKMTSNGIRFTQGYSGSTVSAPSRCVMLTGKHTGHSIVRGNDEDASRGDVWNHHAMLADSTLEGQFPMPASTYTLGHLMQEAGYKTGLMGKWGLGFPGSSSTPNKMGFDFFYGYNCQRQAHGYYPMFLYRNEAREYLDNAPLLVPHQILPKDVDKYDPRSYDRYLRKEFSTDLIFDEVINFVEQNKDSSFFMMWTPATPHVALQAPQKWIDHYREKFGDEEPYTGNGNYLPTRYPRATYAAMISHFDEQVGALMAKLEKDGILDNTIIIFTSDNGPSNHGGGDPVWFNSGGLFNSGGGWGKTSLHEGGIRVPMVVHWGDKIKEGRTSDHICAFWDFMPTIAEAVGASAPSDIDGISFLPEILGEEQVNEHESLYWEYPELSGSRAVRWGKWKGILSNIRNGNTEIELFDLEKDIKEENNVASENPEIVAQIRQIMKDSHTTPQNQNFKFFEN